jgi:hypothetical protein
MVILPPLTSADFPISGSTDHDHASLDRVKLSGREGHWACALRKTDDEGRGKALLIELWVGASEQVPGFRLREGWFRFHLLIFRPRYVRLR